MSSHSRSTLFKVPLRVYFVLTSLHRSPLFGVCLTQAPSIVLKCCPKKAVLCVTQKLLVCLDKLCSSMTLRSMFINGRGLVNKMSLHKCARGTGYTLFSGRRVLGQRMGRSPVKCFLLDMATTLMNQASVVAGLGPLQ